MRQHSNLAKDTAEKVVKDIRRATRKQYSAEEKIRIVLEGLRGEDSVAELCRREGIAQNLYYRWSKDFLEIDRAARYRPERVRRRADKAPKSRRREPALTGQPPGAVVCRARICVCKKVRGTATSKVIGGQGKRRRSQVVRRRN